MEYGYNEKLSWKDEGKTALKMFKKAIEIDSSIPKAHYRIGLVHFKNEEFSDAIIHFTKCLEKRHEIEEFNLDSVQERTSKKMLAYSSIKIFEKFSTDIDGHEKYPELDGLIKKYTEDNHEILNEERVKYSGDGGVTYRSILFEEYEAMIDSSKDLVLDKFAIDPHVWYSGRPTPISMYALSILIGLLEIQNSKEHVQVHYHLEDHLLKKYDAQRREISRISNEVCSKLSIDSDKFGLHMKCKKAEFKPSVKIIIFKRIQD